jgi:hypothetical protein
VTSGINIVWPSRKQSNQDSSGGHIPDHQGVSDVDHAINFGYAGVAWDYHLTSKLFVSGSVAALRIRCRNGVIDDRRLLLDRLSSERLSR